MCKHCVEMTEGPVEWRDIEHLHLHLGQFSNPYDVRRYLDENYGAEWHGYAVDGTIYGVYRQLIQ